MAFFVSRDLGSLVWDGGLGRGLGSPRVFHIQENPLVRTFYAPDKLVFPPHSRASFPGDPLEIRNLPPWIYSLFALVVTHSVLNDAKVEAFRRRQSR